MQLSSHPLINSMRPSNKVTAIILPTSVDGVQGARCPSEPVAKIIDYWGKTFTRLRSLKMNNRDDAPVD
jgi:hypothetical protein